MALSSCSTVPNNSAKVNIALQTIKARASDAILYSMNKKKAQAADMEWQSDMSPDGTALEVMEPVRALAQAHERMGYVRKPTGIRFALVFTGILLANFAIGYDTSCVATLTPVITDHFHALQDIGWYTIAYLLTQSATMLVYGQLYSFFAMRTLFVASLVVFIAGSILSAAAPTSIAFIVGRALNGLGAAGAFAGTTIMIAHTTSLKNRPIYLAIAGGVETTALAFGPIISGALADHSTWRLAFWITVPIIAFTIVLTVFSVGRLRRPESAHLSRAERLKRIDWAGFGINIPMTLCLVIALQWGGTIYPWTSWRIIILLALAGVLSLALLAVEYRKGSSSMIPLKIMGQRSVIFASLISFCTYAHLSLLAYYLPLYFQAIRGASTVASGIMYLPTAMALGIAALAGGPLVSKIGYYSPILMLGSILAAVGAGLITAFTVSTPTAIWISCQVVYGIGVGLAFQTPYIAVQTVLEDSVVPMALVMLSFTQQLGGIVMLSIAQNVFLAHLTRKLVAEVPGLDTSVVFKSGALGVINAVPAIDRGRVQELYNDALGQVFYNALGLSCTVVVGTVGIEWRSVKKEQINNNDDNVET